MEVVKCESSFGEDSDDDSHGQYANDDDAEYSYASGLVPKLQSRNIVSKARWNPKMEMAEVIVQKGSLWKTTGIARSGMIYCSIEEVLFLAELGALILLDHCDATLPLEDIYVKVANGKNGCSWEQFQAYKQLKSLGYIVGRHGVPWSLKGVNRSNECVSSKCSVESALADSESEDKSSIIGMFNGMQINEARPVFDVYLPNSKFRKSSPGDPSFVLCFTGGYPPSKAELEALERQCGGVPLKFCHIEHGRVNFFSFDRVELPVLP
ncbi:uncharacterized protein LOC107428885 [Ziziphus jujuba]|uniref:Uncharacterized protein LOC107428885 n=1 Tax=Ziziphus jujuba TaxID=326968 RepID=A0A6P4AJ63_ZIZJJ|nr:uncharacterized protein LOC107428885 [Ziziphus jujuba]XP_048318740.2 uncharacterized protein LOC107428885 [Ziziphus jujuba]XP_048318741.2 uncharacterized protein LOC107428885 [Ziziphus jujuba]XP_048318742.2 uncharacterized protein LOC107428885 [Ziziphus jujuba]XP_048318743.2 uncharacterized protein LOC107428885 [Ziziphus jujuba]XP_060669546.1 uncharacterized protein LOC107428885 [Ziziphus jujuba]XP_060669547.1 uncharacterized protein LOC107428885 [Ziziphus jujuba]